MYIDGGLPLLCTCKKSVGLCDGTFFFGKVKANFETVASADVLVGPPVTFEWLLLMKQN